LAIEYDSMREEYLKNEKIQIGIRLVFTISSAFFIYLFYQEVVTRNTIIEVAASVVFYNALYYWLIRYFPHSFQEERIYITVLVDIGAISYIMYILQEDSAYYAGTLLWFSMAYGMRYSRKVAYLAHLTIVVSWIALIVSSDFWLEHISFAIGWLLAYIILPIYYFKLVARLHANVEQLHQYAYESNRKAIHDQLTGIFNRSMFDEDLEKLIKYYKHSGEQFALFFIDLDGFKEVNDTYGHDMGDNVLIETAKRIKGVLHQTYRLGGDEFVCIVPFKDSKELKTTAQKLIEVLNKEYEDITITLSASVGISIFPYDATTEFELKKRADQAMYKAKESGKNRYCFFHEISLEC